MREVDIVVGNSSSGLYEAPSFKVPTINIGDRQRGRLAAKSVLHSEPNRAAIRAAIEQALTLDCTDVQNPYGDGKASERIIEALRAMPAADQLLKKAFHAIGATDDPNSPGSVFIIAEAGVNHNGSLDLARRLVDVAADSAHNAVKFQTFKAELLATSARRQGGLSDCQHDQKMAARSKCCVDLNFRSTIIMRWCGALPRAGHPASCRPPLTRSVWPFLARLACRPSRSHPGRYYLRALAAAGRASCASGCSSRGGMSTLSDLERALSVLAYGLLHDDSPKDQAVIDTIYFSDEGRTAMQRHVTLLHCVTQYPAPPGADNLRAMDTIAQAFGLPVGYSDHTLGIEMAIAAVARGASVIEKHFTLDRTLPGPDHPASLEPREFRQMVEAIQECRNRFG